MPVLLSVIVPVFNEENTILDLVEKVQNAHLLGISKEIFIVNDGSTDKTSELLRSVNYSNVRIFHHNANFGKGAAIRTALPNSSGDYVIIQDSDLEYDPNDYSAILSPLISNTADVVYGSRYLLKRPKQSFAYYWGNAFLTFITNRLFNSSLTDMQTCLKAFRGPFFRNQKLMCNGFDFDAEITAVVLRQNLKLIEVPISYEGRSYAAGKKAKVGDGFKALHCLLDYRIKSQ